MRGVAIVGRPNVGKSALFNRLVKKRISIVHDQAGVTRDRISAVCRRGKRPFEVLDTGGIGSDPDPDFTVAVRDAAAVGIEGADLLLLVVDAQDGPTPLDHELARQLRSAGRPLLLVINKVDQASRSSATSADFSVLGIDPALTVSAAHGLGIDELVAAIVERLPGGDSMEGEEKLTPLFAIVGRPNVGKSSLVNAIVGSPRSIVSEIAGTTRDAVDALCEVDGRQFILCDTAGIRHRSKHDSSVEVFSVMRSEKSIERADLCVLVIDAAQGVTSQDRRIAGLIQKAGKACIIALNKWDLVTQGGDPNDREVLGEHITRVRAELFFLPYAPVVVLSAKANLNLKRLLNQVEKVRQHASRRLGTGELNRVIREVIENRPPPMRQGKRFKLMYCTQVRPEHPRPFLPPRLLLFVNHPKLLTDNYRTYLIAQIRKKWEFPGLPILVRLRGREPLPERNASGALKSKRPS